MEKPRKIDQAHPLGHPSSAAGGMGAGEAIARGAGSLCRGCRQVGGLDGPSRSGPPPETPWQYKIQKSLHRDSADARKTALQWRQTATEFRKKAAHHHERAAELETEITKWMSGEDWG